MNPSLVRVDRRITENVSNIKHIILSSHSKKKKKSEQQVKG